MKLISTGLTALVGFGLMAAAGMVLAEGHGSFVQPAAAGRPASIAPPARGGVESVTDSARDSAVRVIDAVLVVNQDGSAAVGASVENGRNADVALMGVAVWVGRQPVRVNATEMWLPVLAGDRSQVGAASDAGGFVIPSGVVDGARAEIAFRFDDGTCVITDVTAAARTRQHRSIYPTSNRTIGPVTDDEPPARSAACGSASADR